MQKIKDRGNKAVPPKKSASAYIIFGKEKREEILRRDPLSKVTAVVKEIAACWGVMGKEEKQKYKEAAKKGASLIIIIFVDKERYDQELRNLERSSKNLHKPKKCLSAYMIFVKEVREFAGFWLKLILDKTEDRQREPRYGRVNRHEARWQQVAKLDRP